MCAAGWEGEAGKRERASANGRSRALRGGPRPGGGASAALARAGPWLSAVLFPRILPAGRYQSRGRWGARRTVPLGRGAGQAAAWGGGGPGLGRAARSVPSRPVPPPQPLLPAARRGARPQRLAAAGRRARARPRPHPGPAPPPRPPRPRVPAPPPARPGTSAAERMLIPVLLLLRRRWRRPRDPRKPACWRNSSWKKKVSARNGMRVRFHAQARALDSGSPRPGGRGPRRPPGPGCRAAGDGGAGRAERVCSGPRVPPEGTPSGVRVSPASGPSARMAAPFVLSSRTRMRARCHAVVIGGGATVHSEVAPE